MIDLAISEWKIWSKLGLRMPPQEEKIDVNKDLRAILTFLSDVKYDIAKLSQKFKQLKELRQEAKVLSEEKLRKKNLRKQIQLYDEILIDYEYFVDDADINGQRVKNIAKVLRKKAEEHGFKDLLEKINKKARWVFNW